MSLADELDREAQIDHNTLGFNYIVSYNIRSLRYKTDKLRDILHCENENKTNNISIIALQEIWDIKGINTDLENFQKLIFLQIHKFRKPMRCGLELQPSTI